MKLTLADLEGIKLVKEDYIPPTQTVQIALEHAFQQGSQDWGVKREIGVYLALARDLKLALALAETADEAQRMLKGAQLALGREKKKTEALELALSKSEATVMALELKLKEIDAAVDKQA